MTTTESATELRGHKAPVLLYPDQDHLPSKSEPRSSGGLNATKLSLAVADLIAIGGGLLLAIWVNAEINPTDPTSAAQYAQLTLAALVVWPLVLTQHLLYRARYLTRGVDELARIARAVAVGMLLTGGLSIALKIDIGRQWLTVATVAVLILLVTVRIIVRLIFGRLRRHGSMLRTVVIAGRNAEGHLVRDMLTADPALGYQVAGFVEDLVDEVEGEPPLNILGNPKRVLEVVERVDAVGVIIAATAIDMGTSNRLIRSLTEHGIHVELSSTLCDINASRLTIRPVGRVPMMYIEPVRRDGWRPRAKRAFDVVGAAVVLLVSSPLLLLAGLAVKLTSSGPVFFRQERVGRDGRLFQMIKLRTMVNDAEAQLDELLHLSETDGPLFKIKDDPRVTRVGALLRRTSMDELPQLINVLRGEMSLVGPRPALLREVDRWDPSLHNRLRVQPGITGMWQVAGRSKESHDSTYAQLDLYYVDNWTVVTDLAILARTVPVVLRRKGQY